MGLNFLQNFTVDKIFLMDIFETSDNHFQKLKHLFLISLYYVFTIFFFLSPLPDRKNLSESYLITSTIFSFSFD